MFLYRLVVVILGIMINVKLITVYQYCHFNGLKECRKFTSPYRSSPPRLQSNYINCIPSTHLDAHEAVLQSVI